MTSRDILDAVIAARRVNPRWSWAAVWLAAGLVWGCSKSTPPPPASDQSARPNSAGTASAPPPPLTSPAPEPAAVAREDDGETPPPSVIVLVDGSRDDHTLWRGWPVIVHLAVLAGEAPQDLHVRGPSAVEPTRANNLWIIPGVSSGRLEPGVYVFSCGTGSTEVKVEDPPAVLSPDERDLQRSLEINSALALGDAKAALRTADEWIAAEPSSFEGYAARGDALRALGKQSAALVAYNDAIRRVPRGDMPPAGLHAQFAELLREAVAALPTPIAVGAPVLAQATPPSLPGPPVAQPSSGPGVLVLAAELVDATICADTAGQWAVTATAGTQYGRTQYSAAQATGAPNISVAGNSPDAWCPASKTNGTDWLEVTFARPVHATELRVRQNDAAGAITKIEAIDPDGMAHVWWEGVDLNQAPVVREIVWFAVRVPKTSYLVAKVKITLNLAAGPGWKEIDAVQLVGAAQ